jgi:hypothetical protein
MRLEGSAKLGYRMFLLLTWRSNLWDRDNIGVCNSRSQHGGGGVDIVVSSMRRSYIILRSSSGRPRKETVGGCGARASWGGSPIFLILGLTFRAALAIEMKFFLNGYLPDPTPNFAKPLDPTLYINHYSISPPQNKKLK